MTDTPDVCPAHENTTAPAEPVGSPVPGMPRRPADVPLPERMKHLQLDERGYPILATIPQPTGKPDFGAISEERKLVLAAYDLCSVCALPFSGDDLRWQVAFPSHAEFALANETGLPVVFSEAPAHRVCALYAAQVCPFVASPYARMGDGARRGLRRGDTLAVLGYRTTSNVTVQESHIQDMHVLVFEMDGLEERLSLSNATEAQAAYRAALDQDVPVTVDAETQALVDLITSPAVSGAGNGDAGEFLAAGLMTIGAVFLENVDRLPNLGGLVDDRIRLAAASVAVENGVITPDRFEAHPYMLAAHRWVVARRDSLPPVVTQWHTRARDWTAAYLAAEARAGGPRPPRSKNSGGPAKKAKAQRAARRKNRR